MKKEEMRKLEEVFIRKACADAKSKADFEKNLGFTYSGGAARKFVNKVIKDLSLDISHFDPFYKLRELRKYELIVKICPICEAKFETQKNHKKEKTTCSYSCSNVYFASLRHTEESKNKVSDSLYNFYGSKNLKKHRFSVLNCSWCNNSFKQKNLKQRFCSAFCASKAVHSDQSINEKIKITHKKRVAAGLNKGWPHRNKFSRSFPENYVEKLLNEMNFYRSLDFEIEYKQGRWFCDFAFLKKKIVLEIDGKQHDDLKRKISDQIKDEFLIENGWKVIRIKWKGAKFRNELIAQLQVLKTL